MSDRAHKVLLLAYAASCHYVFGGGGRSYCARANACVTSKSRSCTLRSWETPGEETGGLCVGYRMWNRGKKRISNRCFEQALKLNSNSLLVFYNFLSTCKSAIMRAKTFFSTGKARSKWCRVSRKKRERDLEKM